MNGTKNNTLEMPKPVTLRERISRNLVRPYMANFRSVADALLELVDNAFDEFDGFHGGTHLEVTIKMTKDNIIVENLGGKGMGTKELDDWLNWGAPIKTNKIGEWGQGGKAAMGYLGHAWEVHTKRWDESWLWQIREENWDDASSGEKTYQAVAIKGDVQHQGIGYCKFEIKNLKNRRQDINRIKTVLSNTYRQYLEEGKSSITVNGEPVNPLRLPIYEGFGRQPVKGKTSQGWWIKGWIGRLKRDAKVRGGPRIAGGMRLLRHGRLICDGEYFGHRDFRDKASLGMLIGEVELTTKVSVLPNKTGFDTDSPEWDAVKEVMYEVLKPHIEALLKQKGEETVTREEKKRVALVRQMMAEALKLLSRDPDFSGHFGEDRGRKRPEKAQEKEKTVKPNAKGEKQRKKPEPRTSPTEGAIGRLRRLGKMPDWEVKELPLDIRSEWGEKNGNRCLLINNKYCLYEEWKGDELYIAETAALQLSKPADEKLTLEEYTNEVNLLIRAFCQVYNSAPTS